MVGERLQRQTERTARTPCGPCYPWDLLGVALPLCLILMTLLQACGTVLGVDEADPEKKISGIADYGRSNPEPPASTTLDPAVEAFWSQVDALIAALPRREASRLIENLRTLRARFERSTADLVLQVSSRFISSGDLSARVASGSFDLALILEQHSGAGLEHILVQMLSVSAEEFPQFVDSLPLERPVAASEKFLEEAEDLLDSIAATPDMKPRPGNYVTVQMITLSSATDGAQIYYTLDGTEPSRSATPCTEPFPIGTDQESVVIKAIAVKEGLIDSPMFLGTYNILLPTVPLPTVNLDAGLYNDEILILPVNRPSDVDWRFTLDGSVPGPTSEPFVESSGVLLGAGSEVILKVRGFGDGKRPGPVLTREYRVDASPPVVETATVALENAVQGGGVTVKWHGAQDNFDAPGRLKYTIWIVSQPEVVVELLADEAAGTTAGLIYRSGFLAGQTGENTYRVIEEDLNGSLFVVVSVEDSAGNHSIYEATSVSF